jgi:hypothetical protein
VTDRWKQAQRISNRIWPVIIAWVDEDPGRVSGDLADATGQAITELGLLPYGARRSVVFDTRVLVRAALGHQRYELRKRAAGGVRG